MKKKRIIIIASSIAVVLIISACLLYRFYYSGKDARAQKGDIVAEVGGHIITAEDLKLNYEFGFSNLKKGNSTKEKLENYLQLMINEKLFAIEAGRLGYDENETIKKLEKDLLNELLVEALVKKDVADKITVAENEIKEAVNKSKVKFKFRFWVEDNLEQANRTYSDMKRRGYEKVISEILKVNPEIKIQPKKLESGYLTWLDVNEEVLNAVKNLKVGEISKPVFVDNSYYLFQIMDIKRSAVTVNEYQSQAPSFKKILFSKKYQHNIVGYVNNIMQPVNLVTKAKQFRLLADATAEWKSNPALKGKSFCEVFTDEKNQNPVFKKLKENENETIVKFAGGSFDVKSFVNMFDFSKVNADPEVGNHFRKVFNDRIAITMRDYFLAKNAKSRNIESLPWLQKELSDWRDKWVYRKYVEDYLNKNLKNIPAPQKDKYSKQIITEKLESLKSAYKVKIYSSVLDTIKVTESKKSKWMSLQLYKAGSGRDARPTVDPVWKNL